MLIHNALLTGSITLNGSDVSNITGSANYSASFSSRITNNEATGSTLTAASSSFSTRVTGLEASSGSFSTRTTNIERVYATTGSNTFTAAQVIQGTLTAQTLIVQTVTSSVLFSTGSNRLGNSLSNVQELTGSVGITGSFAVNTNGTEFQVSAGGVSIGNALTDNHIISGSVTINPNGLFVSSSGNVGIGTALPTTKLYVQSADADFISVFKNTNASGYGVQIYTQGSGTNLAFQVRSNNGAINALQVLDNGNIGIGNTSPGLNLSVQGLYGLPATSGVQGTGILRVQDSASNIALDMGVIQNVGTWIQSGNKANSAVLPLSLNQNGGNVLIGTTTDNGNKLNVNGSISAGTGNFSVVNSTFKSYTGTITLASNQTGTIYTMGTMGLYTVQAVYPGAAINFSASAIFYAHSIYGGYVKCLDLYDGANIYLSNSGAAIQVRNDGYATYVFDYSILFQPQY